MTEQDVFIHELGHFFIDQMNYYNYENFTKVKSIVIKKDDLGRSQGYTELEIPKNYIKTEIIPKDRIMQRLVSLIAGCVFQSVYMNSEIYSCLSSNGNLDQANFASICVKNNLNKNILFEIINKDLNQIVESEKFKNEILSLKYEDYVLEGFGDELNINIESLDVYLKPYYNQFISKYDEIIKKMQRELL